MTNQWTLLGAGSAWWQGLLATFVIQHPRLELMGCWFMEKYTFWFCPFSWNDDPKSKHVQQRCPNISNHIQTLTTWSKLRLHDPNSDYMIQISPNDYLSSSKITKPMPKISCLFMFQIFFKPLSTTSPRLVSFLRDQLGHRSAGLQAAAELPGAAERPSSGHRLHPRQSLRLRRHRQRGGRRGASGRESLNIYCKRKICCVSEKLWKIYRTG